MDHVSTYEKVFIGEFLFIESALMLTWFFIGYVIVFPTVIVHLLLWSFPLALILYAEKIRSLEEKNEHHETELQSKENMISELSAQLEAEKIKNENQNQVEEISISEIACFAEFSKKGTSGRSFLLKHFPCICVVFTWPSLPSENVAGQRFSCRELDFWKRGTKKR